MLAALCCDDKSRRADGAITCSLQPRTLPLVCHMPALNEVVLADGWYQLACCLRLQAQPAACQWRPGQDGQLQEHQQRAGSRSTSGDRSRQEWQLQAGGSGAAASCGCCRAFGRDFPSGPRRAIQRPLPGGARGKQCPPWADASPVGRFGRPCRTAQCSVSGGCQVTVSCCINALLQAHSETISVGVAFDMCTNSARLPGQLLLHCSFVSRSGQAVVDGL